MRKVRLSTKNFLNMIKEELYHKSVELEEWKDIMGYEGHYKVSNKGNVKSIERFVAVRNGKRKCKEIILKYFINQFGYSHVALNKNNSGRTVKISRLVAIHFVPNPLSLPEVNHIDGNKLNNNANNLEWVTRLANMRHAIKTGLIKCTDGIVAQNRKLAKDQVVDIYKSSDRPRVLAQKYNVSQACINDIKNGRNWQQVTNSIIK